MPSVFGDSEVRKLAAEAGLGLSYEVYVDQIDTTSYSPEPNPAWIWEDPNGHAHTWYSLGPDGTWRWINDDADGEDFLMDGDGEEHNALATPRCLACLCKVDLKDAYLSADPWRTQTPGASHYFIDGEEVSREKFDSDATALSAIIEAVKVRRLPEDALKKLNELRELLKQIPLDENNPTFTIHGAVSWELGSLDERIRAVVRSRRTR